MAQRTVTDCDRCGAKEAKGAEGFYIPVDTQTDPAGGPSETIEEVIDLCPKCMATELKRFLKSLTYAEGAEWVRRVVKR